MDSMADKIKQEYIDSGADLRDLEYALKRLKDECAGEFPNEEAAMDFLHRPN